jgi:hypothetical protein
MSSVKMANLIDRIEKRSRFRIETLALDIANRDFIAAEEYARRAFNESDEPLADLRRQCAIALVEHSPGDSSPLTDPAINSELRQHCAKAIASGEAMSPALRDFAAQAILIAPTKAGKGRPAASTVWQKLVVIQVISDLRGAGIPVYHGDGQDSDARFYGTDVVASALGVEERTIRGWWKQRRG